MKETTDTLNIKSNKHITVQKNNVIKYLNIKKDGVYVDATFGRGGHSLEVLKLLSNQGKLISIDKDDDAYIFFKEKFPKYDNHIFVHDTFSNLENILNELNISKVDGFIFDLGLSSPQIDNPDRGFSFLRDDFLDMRFSKSLQTKTAFDIINNYSYEDLFRVFKMYGDISNPKKLINSIILKRKNILIKSTKDFCDIISDNIPKKELFYKKHFANRYFQAIRIEVNSEIDEIKKTIPIAMKRLNLNGVIATLSFHSLEEKTIKKIYTSFKSIKYPKELPINNVENNFKIINVYASPEKEEIESNNRSRSSKLKIIQRIKNE